MPKKIRDYLFKIKNPRPHIQSPFNSLLSGCKHPRTPSFALYAARNQPHQVIANNKEHENNDAATLADVDRFLLENFKSLYLKDDQVTETENKAKRVFEDYDEEEFEEAPMMLETPRGRTRFFVKPGFSGSLVEDALTTSDEARSISTISTVINDNISSPSNSYDETHALPDNSIALLTHTTSPYEDFKRSMQEMVNNHERDVDWDFMEELLFCYLNLNHKKSHKFILSAFVDLATVMRRSNTADTASAKPRSVRTVRTGLELRNRTKNVTLDQFGSSQ